MTLEIWKQLSPVNLYRPYRIVENCQTIDGIRSRISHKSFTTLEAAQAFIHDLHYDTPFDGVPDDKTAPK